MNNRLHGLTPRGGARRGVALAISGMLSAVSACYVPPASAPGPDPRVRAAELQIRRAIENERSINVDTIPKRAVGVFPFTIGTGASGDTTGLLTDALGFGFADLLSTDLAKSRDLVVVERLRLDALLREQQFGASGYVDSATAPRAGKLLGARRILTGELFTNRDQITMTARVTDVAAPNNAGVVSGRAGIDAIFDAEKELALRIFDELGVVLTPAEHAAVEQRPTKNISAFLAYSRGLQLEAVGRFTDAAREYQTAARLDPGFGAATTHMREAQEFGSPIPQSAQPGGATQGSLVRASEVAVDHVNAIVVTTPGSSQQSTSAANPAFPTQVTTIIVTIRPPS